MNSLNDSLKVGIDLIPCIALLGLTSMIRPMIAPEIEKRLGRKMTDWEWGYYLEESYRKFKADSLQDIVGQWLQRLAVMQIIHDFVWGGE
ncbi:hypothetical protein [Dehalococcoides mccartyi]|uniref:hypothetical protein n=1 Tax=Dehalococcoides mccartyi TaxID=61435 RepID=UPI0003C839EF|nr:hypothetical protein [Dehalococcoides mccartyi]AHB13484.1 hypothetical protein GY50_0704 [Dehalococcoides mccartyi GY50]